MEDLDPDLDPPAVTDDAILTPLERLAVLVLWLAFAWLPPLLLWGVWGYFGEFYSPLMWLVIIGATTPLMGRLVGQVEAIDALPPAPRPRSHLPAALAELVGEAAAIRGELRQFGLDAALERAWRLLGDFERLPEALTAGLDHPRDALAGVREVIDAHARTRWRFRSLRQQHQRLDAALARFEAALAAPRGVGFRGDSSRRA